MTLGTYLALAAVLVLAITPGPVVVATVARTLVSGIKPALGLIVGVALVDLAYLLRGRAAGSGAPGRSRP